MGKKFWLFGAPKYHPSLHSNHNLDPNQIQLYVFVLLDAPILGFINFQELLGKNNNAILLPETFLVDTC